MLLAFNSSNTGTNRQVFEQYLTPLREERQRGCRILELYEEDKLHGALEICCMEPLLRNRGEMIALERCLRSRKGKYVTLKCTTSEIKPFIIDLGAFSEDSLPEFKGEAD